MLWVNAFSLDGWMEGWMDGRMGGWMEGWVDGWWMDGRMDGTPEVKFDACKKNFKKTEKYC